MRFDPLNIYIYIEKGLTKEDNLLCPHVPYESSKVIHPSESNPSQEATHSPGATNSQKLAGGVSHDISISANTCTIDNHSKMNELSSPFFLQFFLSTPILFITHKWSRKWGNRACTEVVVRFWKWGKGNPMQTVGFSIPLPTHPYLLILSTHTYSNQPTCRLIPAELPHPSIVSIRFHHSGSCGGCGIASDTRESIIDFLGIS